MASKCGTCWIRIGAICAALSVVLGAFAAHWLGDFLLKKYDGQTHTVLGEVIPSAAKYLKDFKTAAEYQMYHSLAVLVVGILAIQRPSQLLNIAGCCFIGGTLLFSGSLYTLVLTGTKWLGAITPFGGVLFIIGWVLLACAAKSACTPCVTKPE